MAVSQDFDSFEVGQRASLDHTVTTEDVAAFAKLSGDDNPVHVDEAYATGLGLGGRVAHGMLTASYVSTVIGTLLPGPGALWLSESFKFRAPVRIGDEIRVTATIRRLSPATRVMVLDVAVHNQQARLVLEGEARVHVLDRLATVSEPRGAVGTVVVTGASRGIGATIAKRLGAEGLPVVVNFHSSEPRAKDVASQIRDSGGDASIFRADITEPDAVTDLMNYATECHGPVEVLVNNAATSIDRLPVAQLTWRDMQRQLDTYLMASFLCTQALLPDMIERGFGRIINVTSQAAYGAPPPKMASYSVAKAALATWTRCLAQECGAHGVTANAVAPGMVDTELVADVPQRAKLALAAQTPLRQLTSPSAVADVVAFLVSSAAAGLTGQTFHLSGGQVMP